MCQIPRSYYDTIPCSIFDYNAIKLSTADHKNKIINHFVKYLQSPCFIVYLDKNKIFPLSNMHFSFQEK